MEKETGKKSTTVKLLVELEKEGLRYLVVGGFASNLYGVERATFDIDIAIFPESKEVGHLLETLLRLGYKRLYDPDSGDFIANLRGLDPENVLKRDSIRARNDRAIDIMIIPSARFDFLWQYRVEIEYEGAKIPLPNPMDLIHMNEQSSRPVDIEDAKKLRHLIGSKRKKKE
jgi:hypothetical protein